VKKLRLVLSDAAIADVVERADWYRGHGIRKAVGEDCDLALVRIVSNPAAGTRCSFQSIDLRDVRRTTIAEFPKHLLFYRLREADVFILRVVHGARDL
jgi:plasmid stabilization system protein ParE